MSILKASPLRAVRNGFFCVPLILCMSAQAATFDADALSVPQNGQERADASLMELTTDFSIEDRLLFNLARQALWKEEFDKAVKLSRELTKSVPDSAEAWFTLGLALANVEQFEEAIASLKQSSDLYDTNAEPLRIAADVMLANGQRAEAKDLYRAAIEKDAGNWFSAISLANILVEDGAVGEAIGTLETAVEEIGTAALEPRVDLARLYASTGKFDDAVSVVSQFTADRPDVPAGWLMLGLVNVAAERDEAAITALRKSLELAPENLQAMLALARAEQRVGQTDAAIDTMTKVTAIYPENEVAIIELGGLYESEDNLEAALEVYQTAIADSPRVSASVRLRAARIMIAIEQYAGVAQILEPALALRGDEADTAIALVSLSELKIDGLEAAMLPLADAQSATPFRQVAGALIAEQQFEDAERVLVAGRKAFPEDVSTLIVLGRLYGGLRKYEEGLEAFSAAMKLAPDAAEPRRGAMMVLNRLEQPEKALAIAEALVASADASVQDQVWLGVFAEETGARGRAMQAYESVLKADENNIVALNNLAALLLNDDPVRAVELAQKAVSAAPQATSLRSTLAWAQYHSGALDAAEATLRVLVDEDPDNARNLYRLGKVLIDNGDDEAGRRNVEHALELSETFDGVSDARAIVSQ